jgi:hypothetical protein
MDIFPHFHWIAIEGIRPNIAENFIREKRKENEKNNSIQINNTNSLTKTNNIDINNNNNVDDLGENSNYKPSNMTMNNININNTYNINNLMATSLLLNNTGQNNSYKPNNFYSNLPLNEKSNVVQPIIHNISKELQIFLENFEIRFRKEVKLIKLNEETLESNRNVFNISKELEITLNAIQLEPGIVELLPYILEFLMSVYNNKQHLKEPRVQLIIIWTLKSIILNVYFNLSPYIHQIVSLLTSVVLLGIEKVFSEDIVILKLEAAYLLVTLHKKIQFMYPEFIKHLLLVVNKCVTLRQDNPRLVSLFGAINVIF